MSKPSARVGFWDFTAICLCYVWGFTVYLAAVLPLQAWLGHHYHNHHLLFIIITTRIIIAIIITTIISIITTNSSS